MVLVITRQRLLGLISLSLLAGAVWSFAPASGFCSWGRVADRKTRTFASVAEQPAPNGTRRGPGDSRPNNSFNDRRSYNSSGRSFSRPNGAGGRGGGRGPGGPGRGGSPALTLKNPMKVQRIVAPSPPQQERNDNNRRSNNNNNNQAQRRGGGGGKISSDGDSFSKSGDDDTNNNNKGQNSDSIDSAVAPKSVGNRKRFQPGKRKTQNEDKEGDKRNARRNSLKFRTGKTGRLNEINARRGNLKKRNRSAEKEARAEAAMERRTVVLPDGPISVSELAGIIDEKPVAVIKFLMTDLGVMASMTQNLDPATCIAVAEGFGKIVGGSSDEDEDEDENNEEGDESSPEDGSALATGYVPEEDDPEDLLPRAPVVTIMGHVDHGKTSLLDAIRDSQVVKGEAGGITQHIAAYQVKHQGKDITFIDTPGHAAFTDMRERGANITDIVILVVAADDGVKQQTADSIICARQAGVPLVVAINKCDLETADPTRVMTELTQYEVLTEEFGGEIQCAQISAKKKTGLDDLLDKVMLQAEVGDLKANPDRAAEAIVVEANLERGLGTVATTLVKKGTLKIGDIFVAGETFGRVRALISTSDGKTRLKEVGPSVPIRVVGFEGVPSAGDSLVVVPDEQTARLLAENRQRIARERSSLSYQDGLMDSVTMAFGSRKEKREMCVLVKADVQGTAEALTRSLSELKLENEEVIVTIKVLVSEAGEVSKSDIAIASVTPGTVVLAFNVAASYAAMEDARSLGIPIEYYSIVYDAIESVESRMQEVLSPTPEGEYTGAATVQEVFNIGGTGNIAGSRCTDGILRKGGNVRVMRGDKILIETRIKTLRNFKAEADQIEAGNECGIGLVDYEDFMPGDVIECYVM